MRRRASGAGGLSAGSGRLPKRSRTHPFPATRSEIRSAPRFPQVLARATSPVRARPATNPDAEVVAFAAATVKSCLDAAHKLGGENHDLWGQA
jgi:hypothetical protein